MPEITVISPVYMVEEYIGKMVESVLNQTFHDFEFIIIDDGTKDSSGEIADKYAAMDKRIVVIHKENGGVHTAMNIAIEKAVGRYLYIIDSDDWIEPNMLESMYNLMTSNRADLVVTGFCMEYFEAGKELTFINRVADAVYRTKEDFQLNAYQYFDKTILSVPWNKLYSMDIIKENNLRFSIPQWCDHKFNMEYLRYVKCVAVSSAAHYHWYRSRPGSDTKGLYANPKLFEMRKGQYEDILKLYENWGVEDERSVDFTSSWFIGRVFQCIQEISDNKTISVAARNQRIREVLADPLTQHALTKAKSLSPKMRVLCWPMRRKRPGLCFAFGMFISIIRRCFPSLFYKLREREVHG